MKFPILVCLRSTLVVTGPDFFTDVGVLDESSARIDYGVTREGHAGLQWILDCEGMLHLLTSQGVLPAGIWQLLGLQRRRERFHIKPAVKATAGELTLLISGLHDTNPDFPNVADLQRLLDNLPQDQVLTREVLLDYFGE